MQFSSVFIAILAALLCGIAILLSSLFIERRRANVTSGIGKRAKRKRPKKLARDKQQDVERPDPDKVIIPGFSRDIDRRHDEELSKLKNAI